MVGGKELKRFLIARESELYIHRSIGNAAFCMKERIEAREKSDDKSGLAHDYMATLLMIAYWMEAEVNFFTERVDRTVRDKFWDRFWFLDEKLKLGYKKDEPPLTRIEAVRDFRNELAHGKPNFPKDIIEIVATDDEVHERSSAALKAEWEKQLHWDFLEESYNVTEQLVTLLSDKLKLDPFDGHTNSVMHVKYLGPAS